MKNAIFFLLQFLLFLLAITVGSFARPFRLQTGFGQGGPVSHLFVWDGLLLALILFAGLLVLEFFTRRLRTSGPWTTFAFLVAALASLGMKLGFITRDF